MRPINALESGTGYRRVVEVVDSSLLIFDRTPEVQDRIMANGAASASLADVFNCSASQTSKVSRGGPPKHRHKNLNFAFDNVR